MPTDFSISPHLAHRLCGASPRSPLRALAHGWLCAALLGGLALPLAAQARDAQNEGVDVGGNSVLSKLVPADQLEQSAAQQYAQMLQQANSQRALAPAQSAQLQRLRRIAARLIPFVAPWNERAKNWRWEVNLIGSKQINAFCMPGGKIAFYTGILKTLNLTDDEVAMVMGHEIAHALREHARERIGNNMTMGIGANVITQFFGLGQVGQTMMQMGAQLVTLKFSRSDESDADLVGMELAARAGFNPRAGVTLWQKMAANQDGAPPEWMSTHPSSDSRIEEIEAHLHQVLPLYQRALQAQANTPAPSPAPASSPPP